MSVIDSSYFVGERSVPNITGTHPAVTVNLASLDRLILIYEKDYLTRLLGKTLYDEFIAALALSTEWATGLRDALRDSTLKTSPIADYVWYFWMRQQATLITTGGATEQKSENSVNVSPSRLMTEAYNSAIKGTWDVINYLDEHYTDLPSARVTESEWLRPINVFGI